MPKMIGVFAFIPATVLLTISFFVLFTLRKVEEGVLKAFGYVVVAALWAVAFLVFSLGLSSLLIGNPPCLIGKSPCPMMQQMMGSPKQGMMGSSMMGQGMAGSMQQPYQKTVEKQEMGNKGMMKCGGMDNSIEKKTLKSSF